MESPLKADENPTAPAKFTTRGLMTNVIQHFIDPEKKITVSQQDGCLTRSPEQWLTILSKLNLSRQHVISLLF